MTRSYAAYSHLLAKLKEKEPNIDDVKATINDGEPGLMKALDTFLRNSIKLRCLGHFRQNVKDELKKLGIGVLKKNISWIRFLVLFVVMLELKVSKMQMTKKSLTTFSLQVKER